MPVTVLYVVVVRCARESTYCTVYNVRTCHTPRCLCVCVFACIIRSVHYSFWSLVSVYSQVYVLLLICTVQPVCLCYYTVHANVRMYVYTPHMYTYVRIYTTHANVYTPHMYTYVCAPYMHAYGTHMYTYVRKCTHTYVRTYTLTHGGSMLRSLVNTHITGSSSRSGTGGVKSVTRYACKHVRM